jgi:hypothetical protein
VINYFVAGICLLFLTIDWVREDRARFSLGTMLRVVTTVAIALGLAIYVLPKIFPATH